MCKPEKGCLLLCLSVSIALEQITKGTVTGVLAPLIHSLLEELGNSTSYNAILRNITVTETKLKSYSSSSCVLMAIEMLKPYCSCLLVTVYYTTNKAGQIELPCTNQVDGRLSAFIVFENHGKSSNSNHYQLLIPTTPTTPGICIPPDLSSKIMHTARTARKPPLAAQSTVVDFGTSSGTETQPARLTTSNDALNVEGVSPGARQAQEEVLYLDLKKQHQVSVFANRSLAVVTTEVLFPKVNVRKLTKEEESQVSLTLTPTLIVLNPNPKLQL